MSGFATKISLLCKVYDGKVRALDNFQMELKKGSILGLFGPNGAGKSTFVNILANIVRKDSGEIDIFDEKIHPYSYDYKRKCGFVLENPVYMDKLSIAEYLLFAGKMYGLTNTIIDQNTNRLLDLFELVHKKDEWIENCSKGMRKKTSISTALLHNPALLILDEPFADLDLLAINRLKELFRINKGKNCSTIIVSHNIQEMENICDEIASIKEGTLQYKKSIENIYSEINKKNLNSLEEYMLNSMSQNTID